MLPPLAADKKFFVSHWELFQFLKGHGKTKSWLNTLSSRYGLIPMPVIRSQMSLSVEKWGVLSEQWRQQIIKGPGRVFLYHPKVKQLIEDIIFEHDRNKMVYAKIGEKFRDRIAEINKAMGHPEGVESVKSASRYGGRLRSHVFFENFEAAILVGERYDFFGLGLKSISKVHGMAEDARRLGEEYHKKLRESPDAFAHSHACIQMGGALDYLHNLMEATIRFYVKEAKRLGEGADVWTDAVAEVRRRARAGK